MSNALRQWWRFPFGVAGPVAAAGYAAVALAGAISALARTGPLVQIVPGAVTFVAVEQAGRWLRDKYAAQRDLLVPRSRHSLPRRVGFSAPFYGGVLVAVLASGLRGGWFWTLIVGVLYAAQLRRRWKWAKRGYSGDPRWARDWSVEREPAYEFRGTSAFRRGNYEAARDLFQKGLDAEPANGRVLYNLACAEARTGDSDAALEHLQAAVKDDPQRLERARRDDDFASVRDDPRFPAAESR